MSAIVTERFILRPQAITDYDVWYPMYSDSKIFHLVNARALRQKRRGTAC